MIYYYLISSLGYAAAAGLNEVNEFKGWEFHRSQMIDRIAGVNLGVSIALFAGGDLLQLALKLFLSGAIFWNLYDYILYVYGFTGKDSTSWMEKIKMLRIPALIAAVVLNVII